MPFTKIADIRFDNFCLQKKKEAFSIYIFMNWHVTFIQFCYETPFSLPYFDTHGMEVYCINLGNEKRPFQKRLFTSFGNLT